MVEKPAGIPLWIKALMGLAGLVFAVNGAFVWISLTGNRDLVRKDYYQAGLEQDARLERRALASAYRIEADFSEGRWSVIVNRASGVSGQPPAPPAAWPDLEGSLCRVSLRRPEDGREDRNMALAWSGGLDAEGRWEAPGPGLRKGRWDVLVEWEKDGKVIMESAFDRFVGM